MKKIFFVIAGTAVFFWAVTVVLALTPAEGREQWFSAIKDRIAAGEEYKQTVLEYQKDKTPENDHEVINSAKKVLRSALNEVETWLKWKESEVKTDFRVPEDLKLKIEGDVAKNLDKIAVLRQEVESIQNRTQVAAVFIKMVGSYVELVADVARSSGLVWSRIGEQLAVKGESFEAKLREAAADKSELLLKLDEAKKELNVVKEQVELAKNAYEKVRLPGTPLINFSQGNLYLQQARLSLLKAESQLAEVFKALIK